MHSRNLLEAGSGATDAKKKKKRVNFQKTNWQITGNGEKEVQGVKMTTEHDRSCAVWVHTLRNPKVCLLLKRCCEILKELLCDVPESTLLQLPSSPWCEAVNLLQRCSRDGEDMGDKSKTN